MNALAVTWEAYKRVWLKTVRRPAVLLVSFVQPLIWMAFFGFLFHRFALGDLQGRVTYLEFLLPGVCGMTALVGASQSGIGFIRDMQTQFLARIAATPAGEYCLLSGKIASDVSRLLVQAGVVCLLGVTLGARLHVAPATLLVAILALAAFAVAYCCLSCCLALITRSQESLAALVHVVNMPLFFTSTALVPRRQMPAWLEAAAAWNPLSLVVELLRDGLILAEPAMPVVGLLVLVTLACLSFLAAGLALRRAAAGAS